MKVLFLDVDGVLNCRTTIERHPRYHFLGIDRRLVEPLNDVLRRTGAKVCVSSTWRLTETVESMQGILTDAGVECEVVGLTPQLDRPSTYGRRLYAKRCTEIERWLDGRDDVEAFAIVDDDQDAGDSERTRAVFVQTDTDLGLQPREADKLVRILGEVEIASCCGTPVEGGMCRCEAVEE